MDASEDSVRTKLIFCGRSLLLLLFLCLLYSVVEGFGSKPFNEEKRKEVSNEMNSERRNYFPQTAEYDITDDDQTENAFTSRQSVIWQHMLNFDTNIGPPTSRTAKRLQTLWDLIRNSKQKMYEAQQLEERDKKNSPNYNNLSSVQDGFIQKHYRKKNLQEKYEEKKRELINLEIEKMKDDIDQERMLLDLKTIKHTLEQKLIKQ